MPQSAIVASPKIHDESESLSEASATGEMKPIRMEWKIWPWREQRLAKRLKKILIFLFPCFKRDGLVSLKLHSIFIRQHTIPPIFCNTMIVQVRWKWLTLFRLNWCHNPVVQLIILCIFMQSCTLYGTSILFKGYRSIKTSQASLECSKYLQLSDSGRMAQIRNS